METIVRPLTWDDWPEWARDMFQAFRRPGEGEELILDRNFFVEEVLPHSVKRTLTGEDFDAYRAPFTKRADRLPILVWPREIPIDGTPSDVVQRVEAYDAWLASSTEVPKLLLTFDPGAIMSASTIKWCRDHVAAIEVEHIGTGIHFVQEDNGPAIGAAIAAWRARRGLVGKAPREVGLGERPGAHRPGPKLLTLVHSMLAGGDCIDDADLLRCGATSRVLGHRVMAPSTLGTSLRRLPPLAASG
jgi:hypothetical protein